MKLPLRLSYLWAGVAVLTESGVTNSEPTVDKIKSSIFMDVLSYDANNTEVAPAVQSFFRSKQIIEKSAIEKYSDGLKKSIEAFSCARDCSEFDLDFENQTHQLEIILVNLPPVDGISIENTAENMALVMKNLQPTMDKAFFQKSMILATLERNDTKDVKIENDVYLEPENILPNKGIIGTDYAGREANVDDFEQNSPLKDSPESKLDYFREAWSYHDFHSTWHKQNGGRLPKNRKRERFSYTHRQIINRYIVDRLNLGLSELETLDLNIMETTFSSYYPNRDIEKYSETKPKCRVDSTRELQQYLSQCMRKRGGSLEEFIEEVENGLHAKGHLVISDTCRVDRRKNGFMYSPAVSGRDPLFYRWHFFIQNVLQQYHADKPYTERDLRPAAGITVDSVTLTSRCARENMVENYYTISDFLARRDSWIGKTLQSERFKITVRLRDTRRNRRNVIVRVFLIAERFQDSGQFFIEIDRFAQEIQQNNGRISFERKSEHNSLSYQGDDLSCAWPSYLYLPKGGERDPNKFRLVVFIHDPTDRNVNEGARGNTPFMMCGADKYGVNFDDRNFGFPLDKDWRGKDKRDVLRGRDRQFGRISTAIGIVFSHEKQSNCNSHGRAGRDYTQGGEEEKEREIRKKNEKHARQKPRLFLVETEDPQ